MFNFLAQTTDKRDGQPGGQERDRSADRVRVESVLDGFPDPVLVVDADGRITRINDRACELYSVEEAAAQGETPGELRDGGNDESRIVAEALDRREEIRKREEDVRIEGDDVRLERTVTLFEDADGQAGAMLTERDVTDRHHRGRRYGTSIGTSPRYSPTCRTSSRVWRTGT